MMRKYSKIMCLIGVGVLGMSVGCERSEIQAYHAPKEEPVFAAAMVDSAPVGGDGTAGEKAVGWAVPETWLELENEKPMRVATFQTGQGIEVAVTALSGDAGGLLANANRWRGQLGLDAVDEAGLKVERYDSGHGHEVVVLDIFGEARMVAALILPGDGQTWFVKGVGEEDRLEKIKPELIEFARSFQMNNAEVDSTEHVHAAAEPEISSIQARLKVWSAPEGWVVDPNSSSMLAAAYLVGEGVRVTVTPLRGTGGGNLSNINRWRGQLGLDPVESLEDAGVRALGEDVVGVDILSSDGSQRISAAIVPGGDGQTWFFKMTGSGEATEVELERFEKMVLEVGVGGVR